MANNLQLVDDLLLKQDLLRPPTLREIFFLSMRSKNGQLQIFLRCTCYIGNLYENVIVNYFYSTLRNQNAFQCLEIVKFWLIRLVISPKLTSFLLSSWRTRTSRTRNGHSSGEHSQNSCACSDQCHWNVIQTCHEHE